MRGALAEIKVPHRGVSEKDTFFTYNTIFFDRVQEAADSNTPPSRELREVWRRGAWSLGLGNAPIVSAVKFYTYGQAAGKRFAVSFARKSLPSSSLRAFPRHRAPGFPSRRFS